MNIGTKGVKARQVAEPITEGVVRGPGEGFTETLHVNTALLRRKIKTPKLKLEKFILGTVTKTEVNIAWDEVFPTVSYEVTCKIEIVSFGLINNPAQFSGQKE